MSMKTVPYRHGELHGELAAPAPWWKRAWGRMRAWWRVRTERIDWPQRLLELELHMAKLHGDLRKAQEDAEVFKRKADETCERADELMRKGPPPLRMPGPGRKRLG